ncbi:MAG: TetR family transcriptional regulator [Hyphomicrobiales bacterium]|nr:TetR/AcrR family transcriptional regulator [Hyphomicrobiales bacterium]PCJ84362.1 MAG: TetR family transcriptional regulator [Hyphomicrobiales bacterium]
MTTEKPDIGATAKAPRRKRRKEARPGEIIAAGLLEFADKGYAATRLDDVAKRAGVAKGTIYRYFDDKQALFLAAVQSHAVPTVGLLEKFVTEFDGTTRELLNQLFRIVHAKLVQGDLQILMRIIITEGRHFPELTELYYKEGVSKGQAILAKIIKRGIERGEIRDDAAAALPIIILAPAIMAIIWKMTFNHLHPVDPDTFFAAHVDLVLNGLLVHEPKV